MAKAKESGGYPSQAQERGMSPRKAMAGGTSGGNFGVESFESMQGHMGHHPDHTAGTGTKGAMPEAERAVSDGVHHTKGHHPAQAAPSHGPHHPGGYGNHHGR